MKNNKAYFKKHFKDNLKTLIYITGSALILSLIIGINTQKQAIYTYPGAEVMHYVYYSTLFIPVSLLCILCYIVPVLQFSCFKKRRNLDYYYSLPVSRKALGVVHYLVGLITVLVPFTVCYLQNFLLLLLRGADIYYTPMIPHFFLCLLFGIIMYSFFTFIFNQGNSTNDGCVFLTLWTFLLFLAEGALISTFTDLAKNVNSIFYGIPWSMIDVITTHYQTYIEQHAQDPLTVLTGAEDIIWFVLWIVIAILSVIGFYLSFGKEGPEKTEEISDSYFGYRILIPLYAIFGILAMRVFVIGLTIEVVAFGGYTIYRKGIHFKKSDLIFLGLYPIFALVVCLLQ